MVVYCDDRYFKISYDYDPANRLTHLPKERFVKIMYFACAGEAADYCHLLCREIRRLPVCPKHSGYGSEFFKS